MENDIALANPSKPIVFWKENCSNQSQCYARLPLTKKIFIFISKTSFRAYDFTVKRITISLNIVCNNKTEIFVKYCFYLNSYFGLQLSSSRVK